MKQPDHSMSHADLFSAISRLLELRGIQSEHAYFAADTLVTTSLNGIDTHGVELLPTYLEELASGRCLARPNINVSTPAPSVSIVDANDALGVVAGNIGMKLAIESAKLFGISVSSVKNSNHFGAAGYYASLAANNDMIGLAFSNSDALVAPYAGIDPITGTNPIAMAAPSADGNHFLLDMATSQVSYTLVRQCLHLGAGVNEGWAIDHNGIDTALTGRFSALKPLGGYKGQGLGLLVQIMTALLAGMPFDHQLANLFDTSMTQPRKISHLFICLNIDTFLSLTTFKERLSELLNLQRSSRPQAGQYVFVPGDKERAARSYRQKVGIPVSSTLMDILFQLH